MSAPTNIIKISGSYAELMSSFGPNVKDVWSEGKSASESQKTMY